MTEQEHLDNLMDYLDFRTIASVMRFTKWKWSMGEDAHIPDEQEIRRYVRKHSRQAMTQALTNTGHTPGKGFHGSGGFHIEALAEDGEIKTLYVRFTLTEWDTTDEDH